MNRPTAFGIALLSALLAASSASARLDSSVRSKFEEGKGRGGAFDQGCDFTHALPDDPIVYPGQPGASHMHDFFGFKRTNAYSTSEQMRRDLEADHSLSTCVEQAEEHKRPDADNASAYWEPALYVNGIKVAPKSAHVYYNNWGNGAVEVPPASFRIIAGDPQAPPENQRGKLWWWCGGYKSRVFDRIPDDCDEHDAITASITFPTCWNGQPDSPDHRSHVVYAEDYRAGKCPDTHKRKLPRIAIHTHYNVKNAIGRRLKPDTDRLTLASGAMTTMHADYLFAWDQERLAFLVRKCLNERRDCKRNPPRGREREIENGLESSGQKAKILVLEKSPEAPRAGETFALTFAVSEGSKRAKLERASCFAMLKGRMTRLKSKKIENDVATCTWQLPAGDGGMLATTLSARTEDGSVRTKIMTRVAPGEGSGEDGAAKGAKPQIDVLRTFPEAPRGGGSFSVEFAAVKGETRLELERASCFGMLSRRMVRLGSKRVEGNVATCTWQLPSSQGGTLSTTLTARADGSSLRTKLQTQVGPGEREDDGGAGDDPAERKEAKPKVAVLGTSPEAPRSGEAFSVEFAVVKGEDRLDLERATCFARLNGRMARLESKKVEGNVATCTWMVPEGSSGASLRASLSARVKGAYARKTFEARVA